MKLIFYGRQTTAAPPAGTGLLTIEHKGIFSFSTAAVQALGLKLDSQLVLAADEETNQWYVVLQVPDGEKPFSLRPRDRNHSKALVFHSQPQARAYWAAHGLNGQKSVHALVSATAIVQEGVQLYPLSPQHPTITPEVVAPSMPAAEPSAAAEETIAAETVPTVPASEVAPLAPAAEQVPTPIVEETVSTTAPASKYTPEQDAALLNMSNSPSDLAREWGVSAAALHTRRGYLKRKAGDGAPSAPAAPAAPAAPVTPTLIYTPAPAGGVAQAPKTFGLQARAQELTAYWLEREISNTSPAELAEILNLMRHIPEGKRGIEMQLVLDRAEAEQAHRLTAAGKGGNRG
jgi:hypothetical protein